MGKVHSLYENLYRDAVHSGINCLQMCIKSTEHPVQNGAPLCEFRGF